MNEVGCVVPKASSASSNLRITKNSSTAMSLGQVSVIVLIGLFSIAWIKGDGSVLESLAGLLDVNAGLLSLFGSLVFGLVFAVLGAAVYALHAEKHDSSESGWKEEYERLRGLVERGGLVENSKGPSLGDEANENKDEMPIEEPYEISEEVEEPKEGPTIEEVNEELDVLPDSDSTRTTETNTELSKDSSTSPTSALQQPASTPSSPSSHYSSPPISTDVETETPEDWLPISDFPASLSLPRSHLRALPFGDLSLSSSLGPWETFRELAPANAKAGDTRVAFATEHGTFLCAFPNGRAGHAGFSASAIWIRTPSETDGTQRFRSSTGTGFLEVDASGSMVRVGKKGTGWELRVVSARGRVGGGRGEVGT